MASTKFIDKSGPFTKRPSGKFAADGETSIRKPCAPYWVVRHWVDDPRSNQFTDTQFASEAAADAFIATL